MMSEFRQQKFGKASSLILPPRRTKAGTMQSEISSAAGATASRSKVYQGWKVVAAATIVAFFGWGLGFYGPAVYLVALQDLYGWTAGQISWAVTAYYVCAAILIASSANLFQRYGTRSVVAAGIVAMGCGASGLGLASAGWQVLAAFVALAVGWAFMSGAAINIIIAPWFEKRRGLAVSLALTGSGLGGIAVVPVLLAITERYGFSAGTLAVSAAMLVIALPTVLIVLRPKGADEHDEADPAASAAETAGMVEVPAWRLGTLLRDIRFVTISASFALGLLAQVGFLTHQIAFLSPVIGSGGSAWAIGLMVASAMVWRICTGGFVDRIDARLFSCANFVIQALAMAAFVYAETATALYLASCLLGLSIGNMIALPGIVLQREFPAAYFTRAITLVVGVNQFTFAFGPALVGALRDGSGSYAQAIAVCGAIQIIAALIILVPRILPVSKMLKITGRGALVVALLAVGAALLVGWAPDRPLPKLVERWGQAPSKFVEIEGLHIHLRDEGPRDDPHPIVMLHGSGSSLHTWAGWTQRLSPHHRVITMDLPGFGLTGPSPDNDYSVGRYSRFVIALLDALEIREAVLVGRAIGGEAAWRVAIDHPSRVEKLILIASGGYPINPESVPVGFRITDSPYLSWTRSVFFPRFLVKSSLLNLYGDASRLKEKTIDCYYELALRQGNRAAMARQRSQLRPGAQAERISQIKAPTLILWGGRDRLFPVALAEHFHADIENSELIVFPELGHLLQEEDPESTIAPVERFLQPKRIG
jgi:pimeloyl-ACP methyl ester carboxylesterase/MFS family permease